MKKEDEKKDSSLIINGKKFKISINDLKRCLKKVKKMPSRNKKKS